MMPTALAAEVGRVHAAGIAALFFLWWIGGWLIANNPNTSSFADFAPLPALKSLIAMVGAGEAWRITVPSLWRIGRSLLGDGLRRSPWHSDRPFGHSEADHGRPVPIPSHDQPAVMDAGRDTGVSTWEGAIVFLIGVAAVWPILFSTAAGVRRIDPAWFKVARNLGAKRVHLLTAVILPAIAQDILTGIRLALGVAWIVLVPAEYLGVKSGLGYAINDARDTLEYDRLAAMVLIIGLIGSGSISACSKCIQQLSWLRHN